MILRSLPIFRKPVSIMGFGTVSLGTEISERDSFALLDAFVEMGGNLIDTARVYGDFAHFIPGGSEECIGRWLAARKTVLKFCSPPRAPIRICAACTPRA